jgi:shikimate kinase
MADATERTAARHSPQRILLTGFMGAGKSTVGILLAERLGWRFLDLDQHVESEHGKSVAQIFFDHGEPHFRAIESELLASILSAKNIVIALGGGALESSANRDAIAATEDTTLVFLDAPFDILMQRISVQPDAPQRPLLADRANAAGRLTERLPHYRSAKLHVATATLDPHSVAGRIIAALGLETLSEERPKP